METVYHLRVKEERAAQIIEELIETAAVENLEMEENFVLTEVHKKAIDAELEKIATDSSYLVEWDSVRGRFIKP